MTDHASGDATRAEALRIAYDNLKRLGWKFSAIDVGKNAAAILKAMNTALNGEKDQTNDKN